MERKERSGKTMEEKISMYFEPNETFTMAEGKKRVKEVEAKNSEKYVVLKRYQQTPYSAAVGIWYVSPEQGKRLTEIYESAKTVYILAFSPESKSPQAVQAVAVMKSPPKLFEVADSNKGSGAVISTANFNAQTLFQSCLPFEFINKIIDLTSNEMEELEPSKGDHLINLMRKQMNMYMQPPYMSYPGFNNNMMRGYPSSMRDQYKHREDWRRGGDRGYYMNEAYGYSKAGGREGRTKRSHSHGRRRSRSRSDYHSRPKHREDRSRSRSRRHSRDSRSPSYRRSSSREHREHRNAHIDDRRVEGPQDDHKKAQKETEYAAQKYLKRNSSKIENDRHNRGHPHEGSRVHRSRSRERPYHYAPKDHTEPRVASRQQKQNQDHRKFIEERIQSRYSSKSDGHPEERREKAQHREKNSLEHLENSQNEASYNMEENDNEIWEEDLIPKSKEEIQRQRSHSKEKPHTESLQPAVHTEELFKKGQTTISLKQRNNSLRARRYNEHRELEKAEAPRPTACKEITSQKASILVQEGERKIINRMLLKTQAETTTSKKGKTDLRTLMQSLQSTSKDFPQAS